MELYQRSDKLNWMRPGLNDPVLQAGLGFVAHATIADTVCHAGELAHIASRSASDQELTEQILLSKRDDRELIRSLVNKFLRSKIFQWAASAGRLRVSRLRNRNVGTRMSISTVRSR
jgi:hypothetical protein